MACSISKLRNCAVIALNYYAMMFTNSSGKLSFSQNGTIVEEERGYERYLAFIEIEYFFRIFCVINIISFIVISNFLRNQSKCSKPLTAYRIYCISLACSDLIISIDGFFAVSELDSFFSDEWVLQTLVHLYILKYCYV